MEEKENTSLVGRYKNNDWVVILDTPEVNSWTKGKEAVGQVMQLSLDDEYTPKFNNGIYKTALKDNRYCINVGIKDIRKAESWEIPTTYSNGAKAVPIVEYPKGLDVLPNSAKEPKRLEDLRYSDVIHIETQEEYDKVKSKVRSGYEENYKYYLVGGLGYSKTRAGYENSNYTIYEMDQIIFKEESWTPKKDMWVVMTSGYPGVTVGELYKLSHPQDLRGEHDYWYLQGTTAAPSLKYMRPATIQEVTVHLEKERRCKEIEDKHETMINDIKPKLAEGPFWISGMWYKTSSPAFRYPDAVMFIKYLNFKDTNQVWYSERVNVDGRHIINTDYANIKCTDGAYWIPVTEGEIMTHIRFKAGYADAAKPMLDKADAYIQVPRKKEIIIIKQNDDEEPTFVRVSHQRAVIIKQDD